MLNDFLTPFLTVGVAELGDKTQLTILLLASKTKRPLALLAGVMTAFLIVDGLGVAAGSLASEIIPAAYVKALSAAIFIGFGILMLRGQEIDEHPLLRGKGPFISGLVMVSIMELADKTQIAAALFATKYDPLSVLAGTIAALAILSAAAIYLGKHVFEKIDRKTMTKVSSAAFIIIGLSFPFI